MHQAFGAFRQLHEICLTGAHAYLVLEFVPMENARRRSFSSSN